MMDEHGLTTPDGHVIQSVHLASDQPASGPLLVMCHGTTSDKEESGRCAEFAQTMAHAGVDSLRFDFRGHGDSAIPFSSATVAGMILDLWTVLRAVSGGTQARRRLLTRLREAARQKIVCEASTCVYAPATDGYRTSDQETRSASEKQRARERTRDARDRSRIAR